MEENIEVIKAERNFYREELENKRKWQKINQWTQLIGTAILFLIILYALFKRLGF